MKIIILEEEKSQQILVIKNDKLEIYDIVEETNHSNDFKIEETEKSFKHRFILEYKVYGSIITAEKIPTKRYKFDIIVLLIDYAKLVFLYFDKKYLNFKIICLYNFEIDLPPLSYGKDFLLNSKNNFFLNLTYSKTYESLIFSCYEKIIIILKLKSILNTENLEVNSNDHNIYVNFNDQQVNAYHESLIQKNSSSNIILHNNPHDCNKEKYNKNCILDLDYINNPKEFNYENLPKRKTSFNENSISHKKTSYDKSSLIKELNSSESKTFVSKTNHIQSSDFITNTNSNLNLNSNEISDYYSESLNGFFLFDPSIILDFGGINNESFSSSFLSSRNNPNSNLKSKDSNTSNLISSNVKRIIKFYPYNKNNEAIDFNNYVKCENPEENIQMFLLYEELSTPVSTENANLQQSNNSFFISKINLAFISVSKLNRKIDNFQIVYEDLNQNSYDLLWISNKKIVFIFSPYALQMINISNWEKKHIYNVLLNTVEPIQNLLYYSNLSSKSNNNINKNVFEEKGFVNLNLDLRGGAVLPISDSQFIFTTSKGGLFVFTVIDIVKQTNLNTSIIDNMNNYFYNFKIEQIKIKEKNEYLQYIGAPYNTLLLPHKEVFFLSSLFADAILINFQGAKYSITDRLISLAPIHHFHSYFDRFHTKFFLTSGIDKETYIGFLYKNFFFEITKMIALDEINYIKSLSLFPDKNTQFIIAHLKRGELLIYEVKNNNEINNISEKINFLGSKIHGIASGLNIIGNFAFKNEIKFIKADILTLLNYEKYLNKNPEINFLGVNPIIQKLGGNNLNNPNVPKCSSQNAFYNEYILFVFENALQIFNKQFALIITIRLEDIITSSFKGDNLFQMKNYLEGNAEKEIIKDAFVYFDLVIVTTFNGNSFLLKFGFSNQIDIEFNISNINENNQSPNTIFLPYKYSQNIPNSELVNKEFNEINKKNNNLLYNIYQMNKEIINFVNINKKIKENTTPFEMNYPINTLQYSEFDIIGDLNSFKQMENILYFKSENLNNIINAESKIEIFNTTDVMDIDEKDPSSNRYNNNSNNGNSITNINANSITYTNKILFKNSIEKMLSNLDANMNNNFIYPNSGYLIGSPFQTNFNTNNNNVTEQIIKIKKQNINKYLNLFITVYRENNNIEIYRIDLENFGLNIVEIVEKVFSSENVSELPCLLSDQRIERNKNDYNRTLMDTTIEINIPNNIPQNNINSAMPEQIFFDFLNKKFILGILFKNGMLVFYEACFIYDKKIKDGNGKSI